MIAAAIGMFIIACMMFPGITRAAVRPSPKIIAD